MAVGYDDGTVVLFDLECGKVYHPLSPFEIPLLIPFSSTQKWKEFESSPSSVNSLASSSVTSLESLSITSVKFSSLYPRLLWWGTRGGAIYSVDVDVEGGGIWCDIWFVIALI